MFSRLTRTVPVIKTMRTLKPQMVRSFTAAAARTAARTAAQSSSVGKKTTFAFAGAIFTFGTAATIVHCEEEQTSTGTSQQRLNEIVREIKDENEKETALVVAPSSTQLSASEGDEVASWTRRFFAFLIDQCIVVLIAIPVSFLMLKFESFMRTDYRTSSNSTILGRGTISYSYFGLAMVGGKDDDGIFGAEGQTIGKKMMGIRTVLDDGGVHGDIHISHFLLDRIGLVFNFVFGIDTIIGFFDEENRCIHNKLAGTKVIVWPPTPGYKRPAKKKKSIGPGGMTRPWSIGDSFYLAFFGRYPKGHERHETVLDQGIGLGVGLVTDGLVGALVG